MSTIPGISGFGSTPPMTTTSTAGQSRTAGDSATTGQIAQAAAPVQTAPAATVQQTSSAQESSGLSREAEKKEMEKAAEKLQKFVQGTAPSLTFSVDQDSGRSVMKITDTDTGDVLRQIPTKEALELAKEMEKLQGMLIHNKA